MIVVVARCCFTAWKSICQLPHEDLDRSSNATWDNVAPIYASPRQFTASIQSNSYSRYIFMFAGASAHSRHRSFWSADKSMLGTFTGSVTPSGWKSR